MADDAHSVGEIPAPVYAPSRSERTEPQPNAAFNLAHGLTADGRASPQTTPAPWSDCANCAEAWDDHKDRPGFACPEKTGSYYSSLPASPPARGEPRPPTPFWAEKVTSLTRANEQLLARAQELETELHAALDTCHALNAKLDAAESALREGVRGLAEECAGNALDVRVNVLQRAIYNETTIRLRALLGGGDAGTGDAACVGAMGAGLLLCEHGHAYGVCCQEPDPVCEGLKALGLDYHNKHCHICRRR